MAKTTKYKPIRTVKFSKQGGMNPLYIGNIGVRLCFYHKTDPNLDVMMDWTVQYDGFSNNEFYDVLRNLELELRMDETFNSLHRAEGKPVVARLSPNSTGYRDVNSDFSKEYLTAFIPQTVSQDPELYISRLPNIVETDLFEVITRCTYLMRLDPSRGAQVCRHTPISIEPTKLATDLKALEASSGKHSGYTKYDLLRIIQNKHLMMSLVKHAIELGTLTKDDLL